MNVCAFFMEMIFIKYIDIIIKLAIKAYNNGDIPVGAIIVKNNKIIGKGYNKKEKTNYITDHAEIIAIKQAEKKLKTWYLNDCVLYVTMEPCKMCCGAIEQSHIKKVYYLVNNDKYGQINNIDSKTLYEKMNDELSIKKYTELIKKFFKTKRN